MDKGMIIRTIVLAVALLNQILVMIGFSPIPYSTEEIELFLTNAFTVVATFIAWYKNNDVTKEGKAGTDFTKYLKSQRDNKK